MMLFPELNHEFVEKALARYEPWRLGNEVLYRLCNDYPRHDGTDVIIAKFWLIGRAYAAAVERRKKVPDDDRVLFLGDDFYTKRLVPCIQRAQVDSWFDDLRSDNADDETLKTVEVHKKLVNALNEITADNKRSLASKYLHFHFPEKYFIYDSRACAALNKLLVGKSYPKSNYGDADAEYAKFVDRCKFVRAKLQEYLNRHITPRDLDCILVARSDLSHAS